MTGPLDWGTLLAKSQRARIDDGATRLGWIDDVDHEKNNMLLN